MCKNTDIEKMDIEKQLLHDFKLLDEWGKKAVIETLIIQLERCKEQRKEQNKKSFKIIK